MVKEKIAYRTVYLEIFFSKSLTCLPCFLLLDVLFIYSKENCILLHLLASGGPGVLGIWGEWLFIFRDLGSNGNYFRGGGEQAHSFGDLGSPTKKQKNNKGKASNLLDFFLKKIFCF